MSAAASNRSAWAALFRDDSGDGLAEGSVVLALFAIQCVCGALVLTHRIDDVLHSIRAVLG
jgi:hypothetical protein